MSICDWGEGVQWPNDRNPIFFMDMRRCGVRWFRSSNLKKFELEQVVFARSHTTATRRLV